MQEYEFEDSVVKFKNLMRQKLYDLILYTFNNTGTTARELMNASEESAQEIGLINNEALKRLILEMSIVFPELNETLIKNYDDYESVKSVLIDAVSESKNIN